jgi:hypothetical protein
MTSGKAVMLSIGVAGAIALGVVFGPRLVQHDEATVAAAPPPAATESPAPVEQAKTGPIAKRSAKAAVEKSAAARETRTIAPTHVKVVPATQPELDARLKPVLNPGARMNIAAEGFKNGEQFAAVAHAARNTKIPFMVLKHRVLEQHKTLSAAIHASRPDLNAAHEATRAHDAARYDLAVISAG